MRTPVRMPWGGDSWIPFVAALGGAVFALWLLGLGCSQVSVHLPGLVLGSDGRADDDGSPALARGWGNVRPTP